jgi:hypothetical protein
MSLDAITSLITGSIGGAAVLGIWLLLLLTGKMHTDAEFQREVQRGDRYEEALAESRKAVTAADERADASVRAAELIAEALTPANPRRSTGRGR